MQSTLPLCNIKLKQFDNESMIVRNVWIHVFLYSSIRDVIQLDIPYMLSACYIHIQEYKNTVGILHEGKGYKENNEMVWVTVNTENPKTDNRCEHNNKKMQIIRLH